jgi:hypothetical protein
MRNPLVFRAYKGKAGNQKGKWRLQVRRSGRVLMETEGYTNFKSILNLLRACKVAILEDNVKYEVLNRILLTAKEVGQAQIVCPVQS